MFYYFQYEDSKRKRDINAKEIESLPPYKPRLDIVVTKTYNLDGTWAHTRPDERVIVMLPPEFRDYNLPIFAHEVLHNAHTNWSEATVRKAAYNRQIADDAIQRFDFSYRRA